MSEDLEAILEGGRERRLASYREFLRIPSISALSEHAGDCRRAAEWLAADMRAVGLERVEVCETAGHPVVVADWLHAPGAPTILVYGHYDVQPVDPLELWERAPFEPFEKDGRMLGRGAADDKGQVHMHVRAIEALFAARGRLPLNLRFLVEGEEESGSRNLRPWIEANTHRLVADAVVISDTNFFEGNRPSITRSVRGLLYTQIDVWGSPVDLHSGSYGGLVENPTNALARIVSELKDRDGLVRIPGFYDRVQPLTADDRAAAAALPFDEAAFLARVGVPALAGERGYTPVERGGSRPTLDVNGLWGGFSGEGSKTIIPAHAHAKVSCRLVADQDPGDIFERLRAYVLAVAPPGVRVEVSLIDEGRPMTTPADQPVLAAARRAVEAAFGMTPLFNREGGSIPVCEMFETILGLPVVLMGFANADCNAHAPNESMILANYEGGIRAIVHLWDDLGGRPA